MTSEKKFTSELKCGHCQNMVRMAISAEYNDARTHYDGHVSWDSGTYYELLVCPACEGVSLRSYGWADHMDPEDVTYEMLYPGTNRPLEGLPSKVEKAYEAARKVRKIDANAYGVLLGRVLDFVCEDRGAVGETLDKKLKNLADSGEIPDKLVQVAAGLRQMRNIGAHANLGELTERELPVLDDLTRAILDYVYSAPHLADVASERLAKLRKPRVAAKKVASKSAEKKGTGIKNAGSK